MIVVIPAYQPEPELIEFVYQLREKTTYPILVVDDGSSPDKAFVFNAIESIGVVLRHPRHMDGARRSKRPLPTLKTPIPTNRESWSPALTAPVLWKMFWRSARLC